MKDVLPGLKWEQQLLGTLKRVANLQDPLEVIGRLSETEPMKCGIPAWINHSKGEEGKWSEKARKRAWVRGSLGAMLAKSRLSAKGMFTALKLGFKEQAPGMSPRYSPSTQGKAENTKPGASSWHIRELETSYLCSRPYSCWVTNTSTRKRTLNRVQTDALKSRHLEEKHWQIFFFFASKKKGTEKERNMHYIQISKHINFSIGVLVIAP